MTEALRTRSEVVRIAVEALRAGRVVAVLGAAGMGKTAVLHDIEQRWLDLGGAPVARAAASLSARSIPYAALAGLLDRTTNSAAAAVGDLRATARLLSVDDADLLDEASASVIHTVARERPMLLSARTNRPDGSDAITRLLGEAEGHVIDLPPLSLDESQMLVEHRLGGPLDTTSMTDLHVTSEGNPLVLRELVDAGRRNGALADVNGIWVLRHLLAGTNVRELFRARVRRWPAPVRLVVAAVAIAEEVPTALLRSVFGDALLNEATASDAFRPGRLSGSIAVRHALLRDAVLGEVDVDDVRRALRQIIDQSERVGDDDATAGTPLRRALWLVTYGEHARPDVALVVRAARTALAMSQLPLAKTLAQLAWNHEDSEAVRSLLARLGMSDRFEAGEPGRDPVIIFQQLTGRFEAFHFFAADVDALTSDIRVAAAQDTDADRRHYYDVYLSVIAWLTGGHVETSIRSLIDLADQRRASEGALIASLVAGNAMRFAGRYEQSLGETRAALDAFPAIDPFHQTLAVLNRSEALLRLGRLDDAIAEAARFADLDAETNQAARTYRLTFEGQLQSLLGQPRAAARTFGALVVMLGDLDPIGLRTWAQAWLGAMLAWAGTPAVAGPEGRPADDQRAWGAVPLNGQYLSLEVAWADALRLAELGRLVGAKTAALDVVDAASACGHHDIALHAAHLAARIDPGHDVAELVATEAARVEGDLAEIIQQHAAQLASGDPGLLEKTAQQFASMGLFALAHEAYVQASAHHLKSGQRSGASRCAALAHRLVDDGVRPTFATRARPSTPFELTLREREVALAIANGLSQRVVAASLGLSPRTVETHLHRAYRKLGVSNASALRLALRVPD